MSKSRKARFRDKGRRLRRERARERLRDDTVRLDDRGMDPEGVRRMTARLKSQYGNTAFASLKKDGLRKLSEVFLEFLAPTLDEIEPGPRYRPRFETAVATGAIAWNAAFLPRPERDKMIAEFAAKLAGEEREMGEVAGALMRGMIERKLSRFGHDKRFIAEYEVAGQGDNLRLNVAWSPAPEDMEEVLRQNPQLRELADAAVRHDGSGSPPNKSGQARSGLLAWIRRLLGF
jgi:hypothetical protein